MSVEIACPQCKGILKAPPGMAGKKARCKRCQHAFRIPGGDDVPGTDSVGDDANLSVIADAPFAFDEPVVSRPVPTPAVKKAAPAPLPVANDNPFEIPSPATQTDEPKAETKSKSKYKTKAEKPVSPAKEPAPRTNTESASEPAENDNPFEVPPSASVADEPKAEPKSKSKYKTKADKSASSAKVSASRSTGSAPSGKGRSIKMILAALLCAAGGAGGFYAFTEYQKSQTVPVPVAATKPDPAAPSEDSSEDRESAKNNEDETKSKPQNDAPAPKRNSNPKPPRGGPKVSGGLKLPPFAEKPKVFEKPSATIALDHDATAVKQVMVGGPEGPVVLVTRRTFDGLGGRGMKDTIDRYALNTLRRIDQTEVPADAVKSYPRIGDIGPGGDRFAFEHPAGKLTVVQLGTKTVLVDGLDLASAMGGKDKAAHPGLASIHFLTDEKLLVVTKSGVVESWDLVGKKKVGASEPFPGATDLVERKSLAFHRDRDPAKSLVFAFAGGAIHSVAAGGKPRLAIALPHGPKECLALAIDGGGNRIAVAYRAGEPGDHVRFLHSRVGDPKPGTDQPLDAEVGLPKLAEWTRPETFSILTDKGLGLAWDADTNQLIAGYRTPSPTIMVADDAKHWCLMADAKDPKKAVLVNVTVPPEDYSPSLTGEKWKSLALTITPNGLAK